MNKFKQSLILIFVITIIWTLLNSMPLFSKQDLSYKYTLEQNEILPHLEFIGPPSYRFLDFDTDGTWEVLIFDQKVNVTIPGRFDMMQNPPQIGFWNSTGESGVISFVAGKFIELNKGVTNISYWYSSGEIYDIPFADLSYDHINISYHLLLDPLYANFTKSSYNRLIGPTSETITILDWKEYNFSRTPGYGIISPAGAILQKDINRDRIVGEKYTWNFFTNENIEVEMGLAATLKTSGIYTAEVIDLENQLKIKLSNRSKVLNNSIITGYPFSYVFIPKNSDPDIVLAIAKEFISYEILGARQNDGLIKEISTISDKFVEYNVTAQFIIDYGKSIYNFTIKYSMMYDLEKGVLAHLLQWGVVNEIDQSLIGIVLITDDQITSSTSSTTSTISTQDTEKSSTTNEETTSSQLPLMPILEPLILIVGIYQIIKRRKNKDPKSIKIYFKT